MADVRCLSALQLCVNVIASEARQSKYSGRLVIYRAIEHLDCRVAGKICLTPRNDNLAYLSEL